MTTTKEPTLSDFCSICKGQLQGSKEVKYCSTCMFAIEKGRGEGYAQGYKDCCIDYKELNSKLKDMEKKE